MQAVLYTLRLPCRLLPVASVYKSYWNPADAVETTSPVAGKAVSNGTAGAVGDSAAVASSAAFAAWVGRVVKLSEAESRHLVKVFRARVGDAVTLFDGVGNIWHGELAVTDGRAAQVKIARAETLAAPRPQIVLAQAMPKGKTMDSVIAAMVELGATRIVPLATDNSEVRIEKDKARMESKREHWQQTSLEASKQSSNFYGTRIEPIISIREFLSALPPLSALPQVGAANAACSADVAAAADATDACGAAVIGGTVQAKAGGAVGTTCRELRVIGSLESGSVPLAALAQQVAEADVITCLIGPEGDFSPAEYALARQAGFRPVRLASHVLRVKTAATYLVSTLDALARAAHVG